jgi:hypothetical protein
MKGTSVDLCQKNFSLFCYCLSTLILKIVYVFFFSKKCENKGQPTNGSDNAGPQAFVVLKVLK